MNEICLWEILVPCKYEDTQKPVRTRHHKQWDIFASKVSGGLTILKPAKGQWIDKGQLYEDRVIPVRIACTEKQIRQIATFSLSHYRQKAMFVSKISDTVLILDK